MFGRMGVDILVEFPMNRETAALDAEIFAREVLAGQMQARFLAAGTDLVLGAKGAGNAVALRRLGPELGFEVKTIDKICMDGEEVSSTLVRREVEAGDMEAAERLLGMAEMLDTGKVEAMAGVMLKRLEASRASPGMLSLDADLARGDSRKTDCHWRAGGAAPGSCGKGKG